MSNSLMGGRFAAAALLLLATCLGGCGMTGPDQRFDDPGEWSGGTPQDARAMVEQWLAEASTGSDDMGWSLLYPTTRTDLFRSEDAYRRALTGGDWSGFAYSVTDVQSEDGEYRVELRVEGAPAVVEDWGLIKFLELDGVGPQRSADGTRIDAGDGVVTVRIGTPTEGAGIQGG